MTTTLCAVAVPGDAEAAGEDEGVAVGNDFALAEVEWETASWAFVRPAPKSRAAVIIKILFIKVGLENWFFGNGLMALASVQTDAVLKRQQL